MDLSIVSTVEFFLYFQIHMGPQNKFIFVAQSCPLRIFFQIQDKGNMQIDKHSYKITTNDINKHISIKTYDGLDHITIIFALLMRCI